jgi:FAD:protein FMN transferase
MPSSICSTDGRHALLVALLVSTACHEPGEPVPSQSASDIVTTRRQDQMTTYVSISVAAPESPAVLAAIDAAFTEVARLQDYLSEWKPESEIARVNSEAGKAPIVVSDELFHVVSRALEVSHATDGAFDITWAALWGVWDFKKMQVPEPALVAARTRLIDYRQVELDAAKHTIRLKAAGMKLGLGGIAKGYAVDRASAVLSRRGFNNNLVIAGGDLYASGRRLSRKWNIGVRAPDGKGMVATLETQDEGIATSGNYEKFFIRDGVRYHHIIDPKTGYPTKGTSSVTVIAKDATTADAWATALFVLGQRQGIERAQNRGDLEALIFDDQKFEPATTPAMRSRLRLLSAEEGGRVDETP